MKRFLALLLALCMLLACAACGEEAKSDDERFSLDAKTLPQATVDNPINYLALTLANSYDDSASITVYDDGAGGCYVEYIGEVKKVGTFDASVFHGLTAALEETGFAALNGQSVYEDGETYASMFIQFTDGGFYAADYSGTVAQEFIDGYRIMDAYLRGLTAELEVYVPQPVVVGEVDADALAALQEILAGSGIDSIDSFSISDVAKDEYFTQTMGLSAADGIASGTNCAPMMMTTAYSLVIATVESEANIAAVRADFEANLAWNKWICVSASNALIANKGNMVICLMASDDLYTKTADSIKAAGWSDVRELTNTGV